MNTKQACQVWHFSFLLSLSFKCINLKGRRTERESSEMAATTKACLSMAKDQGTWIPANHTKDPNGVSTSWLQPGPTVDDAGNWGIRQQIEDLSVFLPLWLSLCLSDKF